jgi:hypothetical protein
MQGGSVLETSRVAALLGRLSRAERSHALSGLALLAGAARQLPKKREIER